MQSRISQVLLLSIVAVLAADSASAEEKTSWFSNPFSISSGVENVPISGGGFATETVMLVTPSRLSYNRASGRTHWGVGYQPEFEFRRGTGHANSFNHSADANFGHLFSRRTRLDFGHSFVKSSDPARIFTENIFVMPRDGFRENATAVTLSHEHAARTTLNLRFDNTLTRMSAGGGAGSTILNQSGIAGTVGISEQLSPRHKITLSYSLLKFRPFRFDSAVDTGQFAANIPSLKAGIARFGAALAASVSRSSPNPTGIASAGQSSTSASSGTAPTPSVVHTSTSVSTAGQSTEAPAAPATASSTVVVPPPTVPLVPAVSAPSNNPTLPLVGVVTPVTAATSSSTVCDPKKSSKDCEKKIAEALKAGTTTNSTSAPTPANTTTSTSPASSAAPSTTVSPTGNSLTATSSTISQAATSTASQDLQLFGDPFHVLSATYTFAQGPGLLIEMSGGAMHDRDISYLIGLQVERRIDRLWFSGGFQRFLSYYGKVPFNGIQPPGSIALPSGGSARSVFSAWTGSVGGKLNRRTDLEMSLSLAKSTANFVVHDVRSIIGRARISYWLTDKLSVFGDFESFHENRNEFEVTHFSRQRYFGGIQVRLSPPPANGPAQVAGK